MSEDPDLDFIGTFLQSDKSRDIGEFLAFELGSLAIDTGLEAWSSVKRFFSRPPAVKPPVAPQGGASPPAAAASPAPQSTASPGRGDNARQALPAALQPPSPGEAEKADNRIVGGQGVAPEALTYEAGLDVSGSGQIIFAAIRKRAE